MSINRCILGEMAKADFEITLDAAEESILRKRKPSALQLKQRSFTHGTGITTSMSLTPFDKRHIDA